MSVLLKEDYQIFLFFLEDKIIDGFKLQEMEFGLDTVSFCRAVVFESIWSVCKGC